MCVCVCVCVYVYINFLCQTYYSTRYISVSSKPSKTQGLEETEI